MGQNLSIPDEIKLPVTYYSEGMKLLLSGIGSKEFPEMAFTGAGNPNPVMTVEQYNYYYTYVQKMTENIHKNGAAISAFLQASAATRAAAMSGKVAGGITAQEVQAVATAVAAAKPTNTKTI